VCCEVGGALCFLYATILSLWMERRTGKYFGSGRVISLHGYFCFGDGVIDLYTAFCTLFHHERLGNGLHLSSANTLSLTHTHKDGVESSSILPCYFFIRCTNSTHIQFSCRLLLLSLCTRTIKSPQNHTEIPFPHYNQIKTSTPTTIHSTTSTILI